WHDVRKRSAARWAELLAWTKVEVASALLGFRIPPRACISVASMASRAPRWFRGRWPRAGASLRRQCLALGGAALRSTLVSSLISRNPRKIALRACETVAAFEPVAAASSHQTSRGFAPLGAIASLRTCLPSKAGLRLERRRKHWAMVRAFEH